MIAKAHGSLSAYSPPGNRDRPVSQSSLGNDDDLARKLLVLPVLSLDSGSVVQDAYLHLTNSFPTCSNAF